MLVAAPHPRQPRIAQIGHKGVHNRCKFRRLVAGQARGALDLKYLVCVEGGAPGGCRRIVEWGVVLAGGGLRVFVSLHGGPLDPKPSRGEVPALAAQRWIAPHKTGVAAHSPT